MRILTFVLIILICVISLSWFTLNYLQASAQDMLAQIELIETQINQERWQEAQQYLKDVTSLWDRVEKKWKAVLDHRETDEIELVLARLTSYAQLKNQGEALAELSALRFLLEHIPDKERLLLRNIF